jgi:hypothetical protein
MKELLEALDEITEQGRTGEDACVMAEIANDAILSYKAATPPLVLEAVDWKDVKEFETIYLATETGLLKTRKINDRTWFPNAQCYRLPEEET